MPRNLNRKVIKVWESQYEGFQYQLYDTGALYVMRYGYELIVMPQTLDLYENSYIEKVIAIFEDSEVHKYFVEIKKKNVIPFQYNTCGEVIENILDEPTLSNTKKLFGMASVALNGTLFSSELVLQVLSKQIEPELIPNEYFERLFSNFLTVDLLHGYSSYHYKANDPIDVEESFKETCRRVSFMKDERSLTYEEYCNELGDEFFIPIAFTGEKLNEFLGFQGQIIAEFKDLPKEELLVLTAKEAIKEIRKNRLYKPMDDALKEFYKSRYDADIIPLADIKQVHFKHWRYLASYLTEEEFNSFIAYVKKDGSIASIFQDSELSSAPLLAFAWLHGSEADLLGLCRHALTNEDEEEDPYARSSYLYGRYQKDTKYFELNWVNPYDSDSKYLKIEPYMRALKNNDELDFDLKLMLS